VDQEGVYRRNNTRIYIYFSDDIMVEIRDMDTMIDKIVNRTIKEFWENDSDQYYQPVDKELFDHIWDLDHHLKVCVR
jgi:shikimate kinase